MRTASSTSGQASQTRSSRVGACADGRTSKYAILASAMTPELIRSATSRSYSAAEGGGPGEPALGQRGRAPVVLGGGGERARGAGARPALPDDRADAGVAGVLAVPVRGAGRQS